jgi:hypothetical protein
MMRPIGFLFCLLAVPAYTLPVYLLPAIAQTIPVQAIRIEVQDRAPRCKLEDIVLLPNRLVEIQMFNKGNRIVAFHMPAFVEKGGLNVTTSAVQELGTNAYLVPPGQIGVISLRTPESGKYFYACSELNLRDPRRTGFILIQEKEMEPLTSGGPKK